MTTGLHVVLLGLLLFLAAFFAGAETALFSLTRLERRRLLERHPSLGKLVAGLLNHPRRVLATLLIGNNVVHISAAAIATLMALELFGPEGLSVVIALFTVLLVFVGEVLPKIFAVRKNETIALVTAPFLEALAGLLFPVRRLLEGVSDWILGFLTQGKQESSQRLSAAELKVLVRIGEEEGILGRRERRMIQKLFELGERPVRSILTPRTEVVALRLGDPWTSQLETLKESHFSHFPVYQESLDQIVGVVSTHEVILSGEKTLEKFLKPVSYVPELKRVDELLRDFQKTEERFAVCVDEFGGTAGVVTLEDVLEEIFGEFYDEYAEPECPIRELGQGEYLVEARISLTGFNDFFRARLRSKEAETLNGFLLERIGRVPKKSEVFEIEGFRFRIQDLARQRILKIAVGRKQ